MTEYDSQVDHLTMDIRNLPPTETNGYFYFYLPGHPLARQNGMVPLQRHIMSVHIGRWLTPNEVVIFLNKDSQDLRLENLKLTTRSGLIEHAISHPEPVGIVCPQCNNTFLVAPSHANRRRHCSKECGLAGRRKFTVSPEELEQLVWEMPTVKVAKLLGVSDKAIEKRCKQYGIKKPPRGYWAKLQAGHIDPTLADKSYCEPEL